MTPALQDQYFPQMTCFGCGPANADGLQLKSFATGDRTAEARFTPWPRHDNGLGYLNGGIIATLLDCHSASAVVHVAYESGWPALAGADLPYVTAGLDVRYRRPTPRDEELLLVAEVTEADEKAMTCVIRLEHDGKVRAEGSALWKRWHPRG